MEADVPARDFERKFTLVMVVFICAMIILALDQWRYERHNEYCGKHSCEENWLVEVERQ